MQTQTWTVRPSDSAAVLESELAPAARLLLQDELVAFPTETVYGLAGNALSSAALRGIYTAKGRPSDNPLIVHVHSHEQFLALGRDIPRLALRLAERFWPGPLTLIVPTSRGPSAACHTARAGLDCVGVRMPSHPVALALLRACGVPLAAPSANLSGRPSPTTAAHVLADLSGRIAGVVDGGPADGVGLESTVVECVDGVDGELGWVTILRPGGVTREQLEEVAGAGRVKVDPAILASNDTVAAPIQPLPKQTAKRGQELATAEQLSAAAAASAVASPAPAATASPSSSPLHISPSSPSSSPSSDGPRAPGMKYTHYAPRAPLTLVDGSIDFLLATAAPHVDQDEVVGILVAEESKPAVEAWIAARQLPGGRVHLVTCGRRSELATVARDLYAALRVFDETDAQLILGECFPTAGMGDALMNRLNKAAGGHRISEHPR